MSFARNLDALARQLDADRHGAEQAVLKRCRSLQDLESLAGRGGWLSSEGTKPRLKLVRHGSGTFLVVQYEEGWSTRLAQQPFPR